MKEKTMNQVLGIALLVWMAAVLGCATPENSAYKVVGATAATVDAAMNGWGDYVRAGQATIAQELQVRAGYEKYQGLMRVAHNAVLAYRGSQDKQLLDVALTALDNSRADLIALIVKFESTK